MRTPEEITQRLKEIEGLEKRFQEVPENERTHIWEAAVKIMEGRKKELKWILSGKANLVERKTPTPG